MVVGGQDKTIIERLQSGELIQCNLCKKGIYITNAKDIKRSHSFFCDRCNSMINSDPVIDIE